MFLPYANFRVHKSVIVINSIETRFPEMFNFQKVVY